MNKENKTKAKKETVSAEVSDTKMQAITAIQTISKVAAINILVVDEIDEGLTPQLELTAKAVKEHYGLDDAVMAEYQEVIQKTKEAEKTEGVPDQLIEEAIEVIYRVCDKLDNPKGIMSHVRNAREMMYVCGMI